MKNSFFFSFFFSSAPMSRLEECFRCLNYASLLLQIASDSSTPSKRKHRETASKRANLPRATSRLVVFQRFFEKPVRIHYPPPRPNILPRAHKLFARVFLNTVFPWFARRPFHRFERLYTPTCTNISIRCVLARHSICLLRASISAANVFIIFFELQQRDSNSTRLLFSLFRFFGRRGDARRSWGNMR